MLLLLSGENGGEKCYDPSFTNAAPPSLAEPLVERFKEAITVYGLRVTDGIFGAHMHVELLNDGPVTIWMDSEEL